MDKFPYLADTNFQNSFVKRNAGGITRIGNLRGTIEGLTTDQPLWVRKDGHDGDKVRAVDRGTLE